MAFLKLLFFYGLVALAVIAYLNQDEVLPMVEEVWHEVEHVAEEVAEETGISDGETQKAVEAEPVPAPAPQPVAEPEPAPVAVEPEPAPVAAEPAAQPTPEPQPVAEAAPEPEPHPVAEAAPAPEPQPVAPPEPVPAPTPMAMVPAPQSPFAGPAPAYHPGAAPAPQRQAAVVQPRPAPRMPQRPTPPELPQRQAPATERDLSTELRDAWIGARLAFYEGDYAKAEKLYQDLAIAHPDVPDLMGELGNLYYYQQRHGKAADAYFETAQRALKVGQVGKASSLLGPLQRLAPDLAEKLREDMRRPARP